MEVSCLQENRFFGREKVVEELIQGRRIANQLKTHLEKPFQNDGSISKDELSMKILESFANALSLLSNDNGGDVQGDSHPTVMNHRRVIPDSTQTEFPKSNDLDVQRKCSRKRKITSKAEITEREDSLESLDDGYMWRKYGQKDIKNHKHPRSYYRCTYSEERGCEARKHVQQISDYPPIYKTTCSGRHTCGNSVKDSGIVLDYGLEPSNLIRFDKFVDKKNREEKNRGKIRDEGPQEDYPVEELWPFDDFAMLDSFDLDALEFEIDGSCIFDRSMRADQMSVLE